MGALGLAVCTEAAASSSAVERLQVLAACTATKSTNLKIKLRVVGLTRRLHAVKLSTTHHGSARDGILAGTWAAARALGSGARVALDVDTVIIVRGSAVQRRAGRLRHRPVYNHLRCQTLPSSNTPPPPPFIGSAHKCGTRAWGSNREWRVAGEVQRTRKRG